MMGIAIYLEGGGDGKDSKAELRIGMDAFLAAAKDRARSKLRWKLVACGGREHAYAAFRNAADDRDYPIRVLLVDAEGPVTTTRKEHLRLRDRWSLDEATESSVHLMIQSMETWIVADPEGLSKFYGQHFHAGALPKSANLEMVGKEIVEKALDAATRNTSKGAYHKVRHVRALLSRIDPVKVRDRCPNCNALFVDLDAFIATA